MSKADSRKSSAERRKKPRAKKRIKKLEAGTIASREECCFNCSKDLRSAEKALLVEEELSRIFCTEECISAFFGPEIARLEKQYFKLLSPSDLNAEAREKNAHLRWLTLEEPDEVWREKTLAGDYRYTLISEFQPGSKPVWCVCITLFLRGEPSFLYLAFPTKNAAMVNAYRRGERVQWSRSKADGGKQIHASAGEKGEQPAPTDGLAAAWTHEETLRAQINVKRRSDDIPNEDYELYQGCVDKTLEEPDEVWSLRTDGEDSPRIYHFIRHFPEEKPGVWYLIVARETDDPEQIEILDAFPTKDQSLAERFRQGEQEIGSEEPAVSSPSRLVH